MARTEWTEIYEGDLVSDCPRCGRQAVVLCYCHEYPCDCEHCGLEGSIEKVRADGPPWAFKYPVEYKVCWTLPDEEGGENGEE